MSVCPLRVGIWAAVSSKEQAADDKASIPDQIAAGEQLAAAIGGQVVARYTTAHTRDVIMWSEAESEMASYRAFREDVQAHRIDLIWMLDPDRAGRDPALSEQFYSLARKNDVEVYVSTSPHPVGQQSPGHRYLFSIQATRAGEDQALRKHRFASGMRSRITRKGLPAGCWPMGYTPVRDERGRAVSAMASELAGAVMDITRMFLSGISYREMVRRMNAGSWRPPSAPAWSYECIRGVVHNDTYGGLPSWGNARADMPSQAYPPLWDGATFRAVIAERQRRSQAPYSRTGGGPFTGVAFCAACGSRMSRLTKRQRGREYHYLRCGLYAADTHKCASNNIPEHRIASALGEAMAVLCNTAVLDATLERLGDGAALDAARDDLARAAAHVSDLEAQRLRLAHALAAGKMDADIYYAADQGLSDQLGAERSRIMDLQHIIAAQPDFDARRESLLALVRDFQHVLISLDPAHMSKLLQQAGIRVIVEYGQVVEIVVG